MTTPKPPKPPRIKPLKIVVAINPTASFGRGRTVGPAVVQTLRAAGHDVTALTEPDFEELVDSARKSMAGGPDALVVVGGDGMVSLGVNLLAGTKTPLGIVPSGTGNDLARGLGIPIGNTEAAIEMLLDRLHHSPRVIDAGRITTSDGRLTWFASVASAGFDAVVNERANLLRWPRGRGRYNVALLRELAVLKPIGYRLVLDGVERRTRAMLVAAGNNVSLGGGMRLLPDAKLDDGLLDVVVVQPLSRIAFLRIFPRVFRGTHVTDPRVEITRVRRLRIEADGVVAYADGERVGPLPVDIDVVPAALRVLAPAVVAG
ncbi:MAG: diacylglycerol kinase [Microbacteriaceae bacterium]|jgi:diacylglycerol kinase (ATP)|nr:YegS/Rv2252/BmrU family lipid kinase [Microbacteriaceae bacterium]MDQ1554231.1 diacylglycerol kinase [Microbacteriaceae bacterium]